ncbi:MAG: TraB/GumN family protein, partial [Eudoraea sp.]|nr:TraB/GumN family protein [Eudoraea sp.]
MRVFCTALLLCLVMTLNAQERNSLLWEISGNGLKQSSFLYGTMHVSKKIAFHLDDVFYEALLKSDMVALESDPGTWLESDTDRSGGNYRPGYGFKPKGFYSRAFQFTPPTTRDIAKYLSSDDRLVNNILYRTNEYNQNFEEDTYLDMFIYRAGAKYNKPVVALEDPEVANALVGRASKNAMKQKPDEWLQKKMERQGLAFLMQDAYRERNINLLDSIDQAMYTEYYRKNMLYLRNEHMANKLDSVMNQARVFAGIGAAHLPGEKGVISLLREAGYTVTPLTSDATDKGKALKQALESKVRKTALQRYTTEDGFFSLNLPNKLYPVKLQDQATYVAPDLANGSYLVVHRIPNYRYLKATEVFSMEDIDQLLFENIPGRILSKRKINKDGYPGLDIRNELKNGDQQRYQIYSTPLEILIFKLAGSGDYVPRHGNPIFNSLKFHTSKTPYVSLQTPYRDFEVHMPSLFHFYNPSSFGDRFIEGYDPKSKTYFFLKKTTINDLEYLEEDSFELKQIQERFYQDLNLNPQYGELQENRLTSHAVLDEYTGKTIYLNTYLRGNDYYLLGSITTSKERAAYFMNSFKLRKKTYPEQFGQIVDTAMYFSTVSTVKPLNFVENSGSSFRKNKKVKSYEAYTKKTRYQNKNNEAITVELNKAHDLMAFTNIDSVWLRRQRHYEDQDFKIIRTRQKAIEDKVYEFEYTLSANESTRGILVKNVLKGGLLYELKTAVDTLQEPSQFVTTFYDNFVPLDTLIGREMLEDKTTEFFKALRQKDSIVLKGFRYPIFGKEHVDSLIHYLTNHEFNKDQKQIESHLITELGAIEDPKVVDFFKWHYPRSFKNSTAQAKILQAVAEGRNEQSVQLMLDLLAQDLPLAADAKEIEKIFSPFRDSLPLAKKLFPDLLQFSTIGEYKLPIISMLASLKAGEHVKSASYRAYKRLILNDARIQLKRHLGHENGEVAMNQNASHISRRET